ncbi:MAG: hypothetical protein AUJ57_04250 [Zetaproteobacteria bacterium CG1_02_53_45]|nr:MAG: hypothetical protein AUJ57_04250 [Zetaproteobacteria bacterium CG1_02_53_45]
MQQLIHESLIFDQANCRGFLTGSGRLIESNRRSATAADDSYMGVYLKTDSQGVADRRQATLLQQLFVKATGREPSFYLLLECSHKGRTEAWPFADAALTQALDLDMLEDGDLYPVATSR